MASIIKFLMIFVVSIFFLANCFAYPDSQKTSAAKVNPTDIKDSLKERIAVLENALKESSYTRIPNKDFENIIDNKIQKSIEDKLKWWLVIVGALVSVLGFLINKYANSYVQSLVEKKYRDFKKELLVPIIETQLEFKIYEIGQKFERKQYMVEEKDVDDLKNYLTDESYKIKDNIQAKLIDTIMLCYYYSQSEQRVEKMISLIKQFEGKLILQPTTYANAAIAFGDMYDRFGHKDDLNLGLENCNKSIKSLRDYGVAYALKLELYAMAITKAFDDKEKKQYENELAKVFKDIANNNSQALCGELIARFETDRETEYLKRYLDILYKKYGDELSGITERAKNVLAKDIQQEDTIMP